MHCLQRIKMWKALFVLALLFVEASLGLTGFRSEQAVADAFQRGFLSKFLPTTSTSRSGCLGLGCKIGSKVGRNGGAVPKIDLIFVLDSSGSVRQQNFTVGKDMMKAVVDFVDQQAPISSTGSRIACVSFSSPALTRTQFTFTANSNPAAVKTAIDGIKFDNGPSTATGVGLEKAKTVLDAASGAGRVRLLWILTDGNKNSGKNPVPVANALKANGVEIFASPIGPRVNLASIEALVSPPIPDHIFEAQSFAAARRIANRAFTGFRSAHGLPSPTQAPPTLPPNFFANLLRNRLRKIGK
ncbi:sushi, von Willebrand factor type A, EGF and pentraxin domain-containing protein 1-like [Lingula anatina]|uniref:Sushi, von Willebrand factor type A, EGF and pentraxin domain-containing protein 1-like n=1 Tax=Lingula anatina TaxID=7574 RepID=A0A1S3HCW8_LINAN|nr:sushi, von Willebrand factor type A, EGF and pentraxin domain-containing protein 1-like [Lingula anatina]|eukprot:XP_013383371.1 sushi, von Willebrand factor type A, EGF and pentraxin domain-containing protein 1-like [Lingula anatina]